MDNKILQKDITIDKYNIFGNLIHIQSSNKKLLKIIRRYWNKFYYEGAFSKPKIIFYLARYDAINSIEKRQIFYNDNFILILDSRKSVTCNLYKFPWQVYIQYSDENDIEHLYFYVFESVFINILNRLDLIHLHSAAVTKHGSGIIIPGDIASGKTTVTVSLLRMGFKVLSDDEIFLKRIGSNIYALPYDENIFITDKHISFFPELEFLKKTNYIKKGHILKRQLRQRYIRKLYGQSISKKSRVRLIIFPKIVSSQKTKIEPISESRVIIKMLSQKPKSRFIIDPLVILKQFALYSLLAQSAKAYDLCIGKDINNIPKLISNLMSNEKSGR